MRGRLLPVILSVFALLWAAGCANYHLGTKAQLGFRSIYIAPVENSANLPQVASVFGTQIREAFLRDGRVSVASDPESADVVLTVDLNSYERRIATVRRNDTGLARSFDLDLRALCTLRDARSGKSFFEKRPVQVTREVFTSDGAFERNASGEPIFVSRQLQAEYQTMPIIATTLADRIAHTVLDVW